MSLTVLKVWSEVAVEVKGFIEDFKPFIPLIQGLAEPWNEKQALGNCKHFYMLVLIGWYNS